MRPIISNNIRVRYPECFKIGEYSVIDDYSYFSAKIKIGKHCHIASGCTIAGGIDHQIVLGDFTSISSGVRIWCKSNDFVNDLVILNVQKKQISDRPIEGDVRIGSMCGVGSNTVIMPKNNIPDGTVIGAVSFVPPEFPFIAWSVYAGNPIRLIRKRNKENVLAQINKLLSKKL